MRVLSLGAGVQSSTLALMIEKGKIPPVTCAVFADTKAEGKSVYTHLEWLKSQVSYPIYIVSFGDLTKDSIENAEGIGKYKFIDIPFFTVNSETGKKGLLKRQCTSRYKINPVHQKIRELLELKKGEKRKKGTHVELLMGISYDEIIRMKRNRINWVENKYPLIDLKLRRQDCIEWFEKYYNRKPPRSACVYCPFKTNQEWLDLKLNHEDEWEQVINFDRRIRLGTKNKDEIFLHRDCKPINEIDFKEKIKEDTYDFGQLDNCEGVCGV